MSDEEFDPYTVLRHYIRSPRADWKVVSMEDYDKLLALYRESIQRVDDQLFEERTH